MKGFRYNAEKREDRKFNTCGEEKNPNQVKFYATNMAYAENYRYIHSEDGEVIAECTLEVMEIENVKLFDMGANYSTLNAYRMVIDREIGAQLRAYTDYMNNAKKPKERKMWAAQIDALQNREAEIAKRLVSEEFQQLSDFQTQNVLVAELKAMGYDGYITQNEIAIL